MELFNKEFHSEKLECFSIANYIALNNKLNS